MIEKIFGTGSPGVSPGSPLWHVYRVLLMTWKRMVQREQRKIRSISFSLKYLKTPGLNAAISHVRNDPILSNDFEQALTYIGNEMMVLQRLRGDTGIKGTRSISSVNTERIGRGNNPPHGRGHPGRFQGQGQGRGRGRGRGIDTPIRYSLNGHILLND